MVPLVALNHRDKTDIPSVVGTSADLPDIADKLDLVVAEHWPEKQVHGQGMGVEGSGLGYQGEMHNSLPTDSGLERKLHA